jgi:hypothetical protein
MSLRRPLLCACYATLALAVSVLPSCISDSTAPGGADSGLVIPSSDGGGSSDAAEPGDAGGSVDATLADAQPDTGSDGAPGAETGSDDAGADVAAIPPNITSFTVTPNVIPTGATRTVTLAWTVTGASTLSISGIGVVTGTSTTTSVSAATTFTLTATSATNGIATADAPVTTAPGLYIDAVNGHDGAPGNGTAGNPYQTVAKAGSVATTGETIYALAGSYTLQTSAVNLADGVGVEAITYGTVTFAPASGNSYGLTFAKSGFVHGIVMKSSFVNVSAGTVAIDGVQFSNIADPGTTGASGINVSATGIAVVTPGGLTNYLGASISSYASLVGAGQLEIHGGALNNAGANAFDGSALISAQGTAQLLLDGVTIDNALTSAIVTGATPQVTLENGTLISASAGHGGSAWSLNINNGSPTFIIDNSTITGSPATGIYVNGGSTPSLTFRNGAVVEKSVGAGITFQGGGGTSTLVFQNARISQNGAGGVALAGGIYNLTMRGTQIIDNVKDGLSGTPLPGSVIDLGTGATAGGNTFSGNAVSAASSSNVNLSASLSAADLTVSAIGNTWDPTANGASDAGVFPDATTFSAPPTVSGKNVQLTQSGTVTFHLLMPVTP